MEEQPVRKNNRLDGYDYSQAGCYFVTICVKDRQEILGCIVGSDDLGAPAIELSEYGNVVKKHIDGIERHYDVSVDKYVIMPNHIHLLILVHNGVPRSSRPTMLIPTIVAAFKKLSNKSVGINLWQTSYHDHIIRNETDYQSIWQYIDENPANGGKTAILCRSE